MYTHLSPPPFYPPPRCQNVFHELLPISLGISLDKYLKYLSIAIYSVPVFDFNGFMHLSYKDQQALLIDVLQRCFGGMLMSCLSLIYHITSPEYLTPSTVCSDPWSLELPQ